MKGARKKGFTLIELLVVIAIIAILAAILYPIFTRVRERARTSSCQSNMKQLGTMLNLYRDDNKGCTPSRYWQISLAGNPVPVGSFPDKWIAKYPWPIAFRTEGHLTPAREKNLKCPSDGLAGDLSYALNLWVWSATFGCSSQSWGGYLLDDDGNGFYDRIGETAATAYPLVMINGSTVPDIRWPTKLITFCEWENQDSFGLETVAPDDVSSRRSGWFTYVPPKKNAAVRHLGKGNYAFWDGHVECLNPRQIGRDSSGGGGSDSFYSDNPQESRSYCHLTQLPRYQNIPWWGPGFTLAQAKAGAGFGWNNGGCPPGDINAWRADGTRTGPLCTAKSRAPFDMQLGPLPIGTMPTFSNLF